LRLTMTALQFAKCKIKSGLNAALCSARQGLNFDVEATAPAFER
jgi:hypothetical protein